MAGAKTQQLTKPSQATLMQPPSTSSTPTAVVGAKTQQQIKPTQRTLTQPPSASSTPKAHTKQRNETKRMMEQDSLEHDCFTQASTTQEEKKQYQDMQGTQKQLFQQNTSQCDSMGSFHTKTRQTTLRKIHQIRVHNTSLPLQAFTNCDKIECNQFKTKSQGNQVTTKEKNATLEDLSLNENYLLPNEIQYVIALGENETISDLDDFMQTHHELINSIFAPSLLHTRTRQPTLRKIHTKSLTLKNLQEYSNSGKLEYLLNC